MERIDDTTVRIFLYYYSTCHYMACIVCIVKQTRSRCAWRVSFLFCFLLFAYALSRRLWLSRPCAISIKTVELLYTVLVYGSSYSSSGR